MVMRSLLALLMLLAFAGAGCGAQNFHTGSDLALDTLNEEAGDGLRVVVIVIDGLRYSESFGDPAAVHIPRMAEELRPQGTLCENFRNEGTTTTNPGHVSMLTGTWQQVPNDGSARPDKPTIFEYFRSHYSAPASAAWMLAGKPKLNICSYSTDPDYGEPFGATENVGQWSDAVVVESTLAVMRRVHPVLVVANLPDVDAMGHAGDWEGYTDAIETADSLVLEVWHALGNDDFYAGKTYLFVTNDHGRHDDTHGGFRDHGCSCEGCEHLMLLVAGPGVPAGHTVSAEHTLRDVCGTVGGILGCPVPKSEGGVIEDLSPVGIEGVPAGAR
jgi:hypothetical protein